MGLVWQTQLMYDGNVASFKFDETVEGFFAGISGFQVGYEGDDYFVKNFGIILDSTQVSLDTIQVTAHIILEDKSGHTGCHSYDWAFVTVVAWTGSSSTGAYLDTASELCRGGQILNVPKNVIAAGGALNSFKIGLDGVDIRVWKVDARVAATPSDQNIKVTGSLEMEDASGYKGSCNKLCSGVLSSLVPEPGFEMRVAEISTGPTNLGTDNNTTSVTFSKDIKSATAILISYKVEYDGHHRNVHCIRAGAMKYEKWYRFHGPHSSISIDGSKVTVTTNISMYDWHLVQSKINQGTFLVIASDDPNSEIKKPEYALSPKLVTKD